MPSLLYGLLVVAVILLVVCWRRPVVATAALDAAIVDGWWGASAEFCEESALSYMTMRLGGPLDNLVGFLVMGDAEGLLYNGPFTMTRVETLPDASPTLGRYQYAVAAVDDTAAEKFPFPARMTVDVDRAAASLSFYEGDTLYAVFTKA